MQYCHMEIMKEIRALEEAKAEWVSRERYQSEVSYKEGETPVGLGYDYAETRAKIEELDTTIRRMRTALARANCTVILPEFGVTIGEALVMLAQWNSEYERLEQLSRNKQLTRRIVVGGILEFTEQLYDVKKAAEDRDALRRKIGALQVAIDRANLTNMIEI